MKKNLYFKFAYQSTGTLEAHAYATALRILSFPRTLLEMFIRKNLGERYIGIGQAFMLILGMGYMAYIYAPLLYIQDAQSAFYQDYVDNGSRFNQNSEYGSRFTDTLLSYFILHFGSWVLFLCAFLYVTIIRMREIKRLPSVFDFGRSSIYTGDIHPIFINFMWRGKGFDVRKIECVLEPLFFFIIGVGLSILGQYIGYIIIIASIGYSLNARLTYIQGDHFVMDMIDGQLFNEEKEKAFVKGDEVNNAKGVRYPCRKPASPETRRMLANEFEEEEIAVLN